MQYARSSHFHLFFLFSISIKKKAMTHTVLKQPSEITIFYNFFPSPLIWSPSSLLPVLEEVVSARVQQHEQGAATPPSPSSFSHPVVQPSALRVELHAGASRSRTLLRRTAPRETTTLHVGKPGDELRHAWTELDLCVARVWSCAVCQQLRQRAEPRTQSTDGAAHGWL